MFKLNNNSKQKCHANILHFTCLFAARPVTGFKKELSSVRLFSKKFPLNGNPVAFFFWALSSQSPKLKSIKRIWNLSHYGNLKCRTAIFPKIMWEVQLTLWQRNQLFTTRQYTTKLKKEKHKRTWYSTNHTYMRWSTIIF